MRRISFAVTAALLVVGLGCEQKKSATGSSDQNGTSNTQGTGPAANSGSSSGGTTAPADDSAILIGEVGSLTGAEATFGISTQQGIELAVAQANAAGGVKGRKLVIRVYDDQSKPEEAGNAVTRLIAQDHVKVILGEVASSSSLAMAPKAQEAKIPMISPSSTNPMVTEKGDYIFRVCFIDPFQGFAGARFVRENLKLNTVAVLKDQKSDYSLGLADVFVRKFTEMGGKIVATESYSKGDTDFRSQLTSIKQQKPEALYVPGYYTDVGIVAKQARELGLKAPMVGGDGWESPKLFELGGSAIQGSYFTSHYSSDDPSPRVKQFIADFDKVYHVVPDALAALGYDSANVAIDGMKRAADLSGPAVRDAIAQTKAFPGVAGDITLDEHRNPIKPTVVEQVGDGKYKYIATINP